MTVAPSEMCARVAAEGRLHLADLSTSRVYFNDDQFFPGWVFVVLRRHATELCELAPAERAAPIEDASRVAAALADVYAPVKTNYELLRNQVAHIHWHLLPRLPGAPDPRWPVWRTPYEPRPLPADAQRERMAVIRQALAAGG